MKYGDTLKQRSIPGWQTHNIDYQDIKHFIKINTTPGKAKAVAVPGSTESPATDLENTLFAILKEQDERITWFVRSKVGEIQRRLSHLEEQIARFQRRSHEVLLPGHTPVKRLQRYSKIETDILKVGEEIQALSRFIGVQIEAFRKLIKKHKKWTGSSELSCRFNDQVRDRSSSFAGTDLRPFLQQYEELLHTVRLLFEQGQAGRDVQPSPAQKDSPSRKSSDPAQRLLHARKILEQGKRVDFDHLMATMKLGDHGRNAVFWIHSENIVELQVLLLQYTRSFNAMCRQGSTSSTSSSRINSPSAQDADSAAPDCFNIIVDDAHRYLTRQAAQTVGATEALPETSIQKAALHARGNAKDEVSLLSWMQEGRGIGQLETCAVKRKFVDTVLNRGGSVLSRKASIPHLYAEEPVPDPSEAVERLQQWLQEKSDLRPITTILSKRARFFNVAKNATGAVLATLDHAISFQQGAWTELDGWPQSRFPHAVLRVRQEGAQTVDLIQLLDQSHLVERVHGFSLEYHAIWQTAQIKDVSPPFWVPLLNQDLRKIPQPSEASMKKASTEFGSQSTTPRMSTATSSEAGGTSDLRVDSMKPGRGKTTFTDEELSAPAMKGGPRRSKASAYSPPAQQYWNEYDNPSDAEDGYVIYLDPNEKSIFESVWTQLTSLFTTTKEASKPDERRPLLYSPDLESGSNADDYESSDDEDAVPANYRFSRIYNPAGLTDAEPTTRSARARAAVMSVPRFTLTCFFASVAILVVGFLLAASGRKKLVTQVDAGVVFAVVTSLLFSVVGVASLYRSGEHLRGVVWAAAGVTLCAVGVGCGGLLAWVFA